MTSTFWPAAIRDAWASANGTTTWKVSRPSRTRNWVPPGRATAEVAAAAEAPPVPGIAASLPGASALVPELAARYSPTAPLSADTVPSTGARRTVSSRSCCAWRTATSRPAITACCWAIVEGRSVAEESRPFCALTTPCRAFSIDTRPAAASTSRRCRAASRAVRLATTCRSAAASADWSDGTRLQAPDPIGSTGAVRAENDPGGAVPVPVPVGVVAVAVPPGAGEPRVPRAPIDIGYRDASSDSFAAASVSSDVLDVSWSVAAVGLVVGLGVDADENGKVNVPVVAFPVPVDPSHASSSASNWSSASSRASSSKSSCFSARFSADSSASCVAATWSSVASRIAWACSTELCAPCHRRAADQPVEHGPLRVELRLLLLERPARLSVVEGREHLTGGDPVADLHVDGHQPASLEEAEVLLAGRGQRTGRRHRGDDGRALHAGGRRLRRGRRARAGGERHGGGQQAGPEVRPNRRNPSLHGPQRGGGRRRPRPRHRQDQGHPVVHAALLFPCAHTVPTHPM